jgi:IstB-like ATP binding protein
VKEDALAMLIAPTLDKLQQLKLDAMAHDWTEPQQQAAMSGLAFDERFGLFVDAEWLARDNKRVTCALKEAKLKFPHACLEAIDYPARRELDTAVVRQLATCRWVQEHHNVILVGVTGTGKSFVACALAAHACRKGFRAYYRRASRLFHDLTLARCRHLRPPPRQARSGRRPTDRRLGPGPGPTKSVATCSRSSRTVTATAPRSPASCPRPSGTTTSLTPPWPTPFATASCTMPPDRVKRTLTEKEVKLDD